MQGKEKVDGLSGIYNPLTPSLSPIERRGRFPFPRRISSCPVTLRRNRNPFLLLHAFGPWLIPRGSPGQIILMLQRSRTGCTFGRRQFSPGFLRARFSTVRLPVRPPIRAYIVCSGCYSRDCRRLVLPMYGRIIQPRQPHKRGHQVGARGPHRGNVLFCNHIHCTEPRHSILFLHR